MATLDFHALAAKWQRRWAEARLFESRADDNPRKFYVTVPYPYMNGYQHVGFALTFLRAEFQARYRRMCGYNVLFPQAFHCTGLPILAAAKRVAEGEATQWKILRNMGVPEEEIPRFADPLHWIEVFPEATKRDLESLGAAVDWRRSFVTTSVNPPYDAFVRWQFRRLKEGGYVRLGRHPVIWCPRDEAPIGDHDRLEGEGEVPVAYTLLKFPYDGKVLVAATLRPETVYGQTNLWVDPNVAYVEAEVDGETWILNREAVDKLREQERRVAVVGEVRGADLVGGDVVAPMIDTPIPILPSTFIDQGKGTGIVTSVPSDAPDDWMALNDLQGDEAALRRFGLDPARVRALRPIPIIASEGWGPLPAVEICERMGIRDQTDREKLERAKEEIYRTGFYRGTMRDNCGPYAGMKVEEAKERIREALREAGQADTLYEPSGKVVCRCTSQAVVKIVRDQWFLAYGDEAWKARVHEVLDAMDLHPDAVRRQFHRVVDWLRDWACAHHQGLGTKLPWDEGWVIESLSDSTVYMAYYTIAHRLQGGRLRSEVPWAQRVNDAFFDYVFRGEGDPAGIADRLGLSVDALEEMHREFLYWYPLDLRNTGKDLVPNHMTFCVFNHVALFPPDQRPKAFGVNGYVQLGGRPMSKSKGNVWFIHDAVEVMGADLVRIAVAHAGDGLHDPTFDTDFAEGMAGRLTEWYRFATTDHPTREEGHAVDAWFLSVLNRIVADVRKAMDGMEYRIALKRGFFDLQAAWSWYVRRRRGVPRDTILRRFVEVQTKLLAPFAPHVCEEIWETLGEGFVSAAPFPEPEEDAIDEEAEAAEDYVRKVLDDVRAILKVTKVAPRRVVLFTAPSWKQRLYREALAQATDRGVDVGALIKGALAEADLKPRSREVQAFAKKVAGAVGRLGASDRRVRSRPFDELGYLRDASGFLEAELGAPVEAYDAEADGVPDSKGKAGTAMPWRPAIFVE
jgi:leucyl-tRNA synthetase